ncbi:MAG: EAL domain-containing protein, partial [Acetobacteraceae bacterium]|nr:EAL domain-containing protein [Acetobacteraceae bacterium]
SEFLPLAEEIGLIASLSSWVLQEVCTTAARWQSLGLRTIRCAVNLSPLTFRRQDVYAMVVSALEHSGLDPAWLELELTESILLENNDDVKATLRALQALGVGLALDDFGTGYSSLSYVKNFPVDRIKIDQSFIRDLKTDPSNTTIVRAIINLSHGLNLGVVAEGVETMEQCTQLAADGCDLIQGYYVSPPLPAEDFGRLLELDTTEPLAGIVRA